MNYGITFLSLLDSETVNGENCALRDEEGKRVNCNLHYDEKTKSIQILPRELCRENANYYLILSDRVKTATGETMGKDCQVRFKINGRDVYELLTLRGKQCRNFSEQQETKPEALPLRRIDLTQVHPETKPRLNINLNNKAKIIFAFTCILIFIGIARFLL